jgi:hypothetical protein
MRIIGRAQSWFDLLDVRELTLFVTRWRVQPPR